MNSKNMAAQVDRPPMLLSRLYVQVGSGSMESRGMLPVKCNDTRFWSDGY